MPGHRGAESTVAAVFVLLAFFLIGPFASDSLGVVGSRLEAAAGPTTSGPSSADDTDGTDGTDENDNTDENGQSQGDATQPQSARPADTAELPKREKFKLEEIFPKESIFGPSAAQLEVSPDGRYAAYLYRPYDERRHGSDIWLIDYEQRSLKRLTSVSVMAQFQESSRQVQHDRVKKAKALIKKQRASAPPGGKKGDKEQVEQSQEQGTEQDEDNQDEDKQDEDKQEEQLEQQEEGQDETKQDETDEQSDQIERDRYGFWRIEDSLETRQLRGDWVDAKDAKETKAPRYSGVSAFTWHPSLPRMLMVSRSDLYEMDIESGQLQRLTKTQGGLSQVAYLPDGSGYTYLEGGRVYRVRFNSHLLEQISPALGSSESIVNYRLSPDGKRLVLTTSQGDGPMSSDRKVTLIRYRQRFADVQEVSRTVSDDKRKERQLKVFLYDFDSALDESAAAAVVFEQKQVDPRDYLSSPSWAPDSQRIAVATYQQASDQFDVRIIDCPYPEVPAETPDEGTAAEQENEGAEKGDEDGTDSSGNEASASELADTGSGQPDDDSEAGSDKAESAEASRKPKFEVQLVYRFLHYGGPNTPRMVQPQFAWDKRYVVLLTEQSGYRHLHLLDCLYHSLQQVTSGPYEVYPIDISKDGQRVFVTTTEEDPARRRIRVIDLKSGQSHRLGATEGSYSSVAVSDDGNRAVANFVTFGERTELVAIDRQAEVEMAVLTDSHPPEAVRLTQDIPTRFDYPNRHGHQIEGWLFHPPGWQASDQRPLLIYVYGGPLGDRKMVTDGAYSNDGYFFARYMADHHGYVTAVIDPRGMSGYGGLFERSNFDQVGKPQVEDLVDGAKFLIASHGVDPKRVAIHGWSFGGFQTQMCLYTAPETFAVGIAGAGPTEWENYNAWYTSGTIGPSQVGKGELKKFSLVPLAKNLQGKLLLVHGVEDSNVLYQDTVAVYRALLEAGKETLVELFIDPTGGHGLGGDVKTLNRYRKYEAFLLQHLGRAAEIEPLAEETP